MLTLGFGELKSNYKRLANELGENGYDTLGALALVEDAQSKPQHQNLTTMEILLDFKALLMQRFNRFIEEQVRVGQFLDLYPRPACVVDVTSCTAPLNFSTVAARVLEWSSFSYSGCHTGTGGQRGRSERRCRDWRTSAPLCLACRIR